jgi:hypothetical protein
MKFVNDETIECGEHTCSMGGGKSCRFLTMRRYGDDPICMHPYEDMILTRLKRKNGWVMRSRKCIESSCDVNEEG